MDARKMMEKMMKQMGKGKGMPSFPAGGDLPAASATAARPGAAGSAARAAQEEGEAQGESPVTTP